MFVLPVRKGGLGNQMFQVAAAIIYAKDTNRIVLLPDEHYNMHNLDKKDYSDTIFSSIKQRLRKPIDDDAIKKLLQQEFSLYPGEPTFEEWHINENIVNNIILHGYFQYYPPILRNEALIRSTYLEGLKSFTVPLTEYVGIHIRRGDYLLPPFNSVHYNLTETYYQSAIGKMMSLTAKVPDFRIFSDDIEWCRGQVFLQSLPSVEFVEEPDECRSLALMSACHGGFICANSSFSWWGAFLGAHSVRKPCIIPSTWFKGYSGDLFPKEWIII